MTSPAGHGRHIRVLAPTRVCDLGGWSDTWFSGHGAVCHLAVWPGIEVTLSPATAPAASSGSQPCGVIVQAHAFGRHWHWTPGAAPTTYPDPLLAATLDEAAPPPDLPLALQVTARVPAGASMGTSAATCMAVLSAFDALEHRTRPLHEQVARAHAVETGRLGWQSGVQDQWAAAPGAAHLIEMGSYPHATCRSLRLTDDVRAHLDATLLVAWLGRGHLSSDVHAAVVDALRGEAAGDRRLGALRALAVEGASLLERGHLEAYGRCLTANTDEQRRLHPALIGADADAVIRLAARHGAAGWKVNGAGGRGGTVTVLCADASQRARVAADLPSAVADAQVLPVTLAESGLLAQDAP